VVGLASRLILVGSISERVGLVPLVGCTIKQQANVEQGRRYITLRPKGYDLVESSGEATGVYESLEKQLDGETGSETDWGKKEKGNTSLGAFWDMRVGAGEEVQAGEGKGKGKRDREWDEQRG